MRNVIESIIKKENIEYFGIIPFERCRVINQGLLERSLGDSKIKSVIMLLVPYYSGEHPDRNVSLYAVPRDYHLYFRDLYERLESELSKCFPNNLFKGFADHSPIGETYAAAMAGLGVIGDKFQLINEKYGSYTFIGEILTDLELYQYDMHEVHGCNHCGNCKRACPDNESCFSYLNQKKGELDGRTKELILSTGCAWGCDLCRSSCPMNRNISKTPIEFFKEKLIPRVSSLCIEGMSDEEFKERAYSWRGRKTIIRNLRVLEEKQK